MKGNSVSYEDENKINEGDYNVYYVLNWKLNYYIYNFNIK